MKGSRVQAVIRELHGEKIDIIEWSENPAIFAANALSPAKVNKVQIIDPAAKRIEVIVEDDQQSLAIGKQGQNVRLAAKLVGWNIDIRSESEVKRQVASQMEQLITGEGTPVSLAEEQLGTDTVNLLMSKRIQTLEQLIQMGVDDLVDQLDCSLDWASELIQRAEQALAQLQLATAAHQPAEDAASPEEPSAAEQTLELPESESPVETMQNPPVESTSMSSEEMTVGQETQAAPELEVEPEKPSELENHSKEMPAVEEERKVEFPSARGHAGVKMSQE
jgi:N utilization substance protein A